MRKLLFISIIVMVIAGLILSGCASTPSPTSAAPKTTAPASSAPPASSSAPATSAAPSTSKPASPTAAAKTIELKIALGSPPGHPVTLGWESWAKDIQAATNGRITAKIFNSGSLIPEAQLRDGLVKGIADCGQFLPALTPGVFNALEAFELPGNGPASGTSGSLALTEAYKTTPQAQAEAAGLKILWLASSGSAHIATLDKPIRTLEDIKGMEIRGAGITKNALDAMGAVGVAIPMPETYLNLQKKIVKGAAITFETVKSERFGDLMKYFTVSYIYSAYRFYEGMNLNTWNSLPPDLQKIVEDVSSEYPVKMGKIFDQMHENGYQVLVDKKIEIIKLSADENAKWAKAWAPVREKWVADMTAKGLPGKELADKPAPLLAKYYSQYPDSVGIHLK